MKAFKIRASAIGQIMTEPQMDSPQKKLFDKKEQVKAAEEKYNALSNKETKTAKTLEANLIKWNAEIPELERNKNKIHLSQTCISYVETWVKSQPEFYNRTKYFTSKYTEKGNFCENDAIQFCAEQYKWGIVAKNEKRFEQDEHIEGTPDIILAKSIEDTKVSWDSDTFPLFNELPDKKYEWQGHGYMAIVDKSSFGLHYCLMDAPEHIIEAEAWKKVRELGETELTIEIYDQVKENMLYSHLPAGLKLKSWRFQRNMVAEIAIRERVELIRKYIGENFTQQQNVKNK